jgi:tetratricopeptide (TPR) repeat protein
VTRWIVLVAALAQPASGAAAGAAACSSASTPALPPLADMTRDDLFALRASIDARQLAIARSRFARLDRRRPSNGAAAYGAADAAADARDYPRAFRLYDQLLFCGEVTELNPAAQDSGAAPLIDRGLRSAAAGHLAAAERFLEAATRDPGSIESRYFLGVVELARGNAARARTAWKAAIDSAGYAQPPDGWSLPRAQEAALQRYLS